MCTSSILALSSIAFRGAGVDIGAWLRDSMNINIDAGRHLETNCKRGEALPFTLNVRVGRACISRSRCPSDAAPIGTDERYRKRARGARPGSTWLDRRVQPFWMPASGTGTTGGQLPELDDRVGIHG